MYVAISLGFFIFYLNFFCFVHWCMYQPLGSFFVCMCFYWNDQFFIFFFTSMDRYFWGLLMLEAFHLFTGCINGCIAFPGKLVVCMFLIFFWNRQSFIFSSMDISREILIILLFLMKSTVFHFLYWQKWMNRNLWGEFVVCCF